MIGASDAPVASNVSKPNETSVTQRSTRGVPKAPTSQSASLSSDNAAPMTPAKGMVALCLICLSCEYAPHII